MSRRRDKRINVLVPRSAKARYQELADRMGIRLATMAATLMAMGYDYLLEQQDDIQEHSSDAPAQD